MLRRFLALLRARNLEFWRDRPTVAWNFLFPVLIVMAFGLLFSDLGQEQFKIGVLVADASMPLPEHPLLATRHVRFVAVAEREEGVRKVARHGLDLLVDPREGRYWVNEHSPKGYVAERLLAGVLGGQAEGWRGERISGAAIRYLDWVVPGVLAMHMMFSALFGVGYSIVRYRRNGVLRRLRATPIRPLEFLAAQMASRLWILLLVAAGVYGGTSLLFRFPMFGSYFDLLVVATLGALSLIGLGLVAAARLDSEEIVGGVLNLFTWPMMLLSGVWFSLEGLAPWVQQLALLLPLTHLIDGARAIILDGAGLMDILPQLAALAGMTLLFLAIGVRLFRWE
jgi:ABC-2 type transport system permease protein